MKKMKTVFLSICCLWLGCILSSFTDRIQVGSDGPITRWGFPVWSKEINRRVYPSVQYHAVRMAINSGLWSIPPLAGLLWLVRRTRRRQL